MSEPVRVDVITIFPGMLKGFLDESMLKRAVLLGLVQFNVVNLRDFTRDAHKTTDDRPFGGGAGMVMKPEPIFEAVEAVRTEGARVILTTPQGRKFDHNCAVEMSCVKHMIFVCGHYEGVDERIREYLVTDEISIGDYVLTNGVLAAAVIVDAAVRLMPGVVGGKGAVEDDSFSNGLLEYPQYTRPAEYRGMMVPDILVSGNHAEIDKWRRGQAENRTRERRPDLLVKDNCFFDWRKIL